MNIKNRLNKLKEKAGVLETSCQCFPKWTTEIYLQSVGCEPELISGNVPETCLNCRKPIEKQTITIVGV